MLKQDDSYSDRQPQAQNGSQVPNQIGTLDILGQHQSQSSAKSVQDRQAEQAPLEQRIDPLTSSLPSQSADKLPTVEERERAKAGSDLQNEQLVYLQLQLLNQSKENSEPEAQKDAPEQNLDKERQEELKPGKPGRPTHNRAKEVISVVSRFVLDKQAFLELNEKEFQEEVHHCGQLRKEYPTLRSFKNYIFGLLNAKAKMVNKRNLKMAQKKDLILDTLTGKTQNQYSSSKEGLLMKTFCLVLNDSLSELKQPTKDLAIKYFQHDQHDHQTSEFIQEVQFSHVQNYMEQLSLSVSQSRTIPVQQQLDEIVILKSIMTDTRYRSTLISQSPKELVDEVLKLCTRISPKRILEEFKYCDYAQELLCHFLSEDKLYEAQTYCELGFLSLLHSQNSLRSHILTLFKNDKEENSGVISVFCKSTDLSAHVLAFLAEFRDIPIEIGQRLLDNRALLFHDDYITLLQTNKFLQSLIVDYTMTYYKSSQSPAKSLNMVLSELGCNSWILKYLLNRPINKRLEENMRLKLFKIVRKMNDEKMIHEFMSAKDLAGQIENHDDQQRDRNENRAKQNKKSEFYKMLAQEKGILHEFQRMMEISKSIASQKKQYVQDVRQVYLAAMLTSNQTKVKYLTVPVGYGKSWIVILVSLRLSERGAKVSIVTLDEILMEQMKEKVLSLTDRYIEVLTSADVDDFVDPTITYIWDEFYEDLHRRKLILNQHRNYPGVFKVGFQTPLIIVTGHHSSTFSRFTEQCYQEVYSVVGSELPGIKDDCNPQLQIKVVCNNNSKEFSQLVEAKIRKRIGKGPLIVFGMNHIPQLLKKFGKAEGHFELIDSIKKLRDAIASVMGEEYGVIFLHDKYRIGVDVKFGRDAYVIIIEKETPNKEAVLQMVGRGYRSGATVHKASLFVMVQPTNTAGVQRRISQTYEPDFADGAKWLTLLNHLEHSKDNNEKEIVANLIDSAKGKWDLHIRMLAKSLTVEEFLTLKQKIEKYDDRD